MTTSYSDSLHSAVVRLAQSDSVLSWESISSHLGKEGFASAKIENARSDLSRLYVQAHQKYTQSVLRGQPLSPVSIPETSTAPTASNPSNSPKQTSIGASSPINLPDTIFMFAGDNYYTMTCEHDQAADVSYIDQAAVEQRWYEHCAIGSNITLSWRKVDSKKTYRTSFLVVNGNMMECDIKFGTNWLRGMPAQEKPHERKRKGVYEDLDDIERPGSKRQQNQLKPEGADLDYTSELLARVVHSYIRCEKRFSTTCQQSPSSSSERFHDTDGSDVGERQWADP